MVDYGFYVILGNLMGDVEKFLSESFLFGMLSIKIFIIYVLIDR